MKPSRWKDEPPLVSPGMKGKVVSLHDGFHLDLVEGDPLPPRALVDRGMESEQLTEA